VGCGRLDFEELSVELLRAGHDLRFEARGRSMHPLVRDGDILLVRPAGHGELAVGDIVLYRSPRRGIVVHRVVGIRRDGHERVLSVKGDAARHPDSAVLESHVAGKIVAIERSGRLIDPDNRMWRYFSTLYVRVPPVRWWIYPLIRRANSGLRRLTKSIARMS
ncbi:MAG: signal peptidase I, partial [Anaerolineae bacterium]|nr:signal peptidase I [Anaerolineae bacterium]NIN97108.1 signal peptidase I [Anaerolineae bacterium]NIQ80081.1 signal peptidase I [Anaerolineae bacterium]